MDPEDEPWDCVHFTFHCNMIISFILVLTFGLSAAFFKHAFILLVIACLLISVDIVILCRYGHHRIYRSTAEWDDIL